MDKTVTVSCCGWQCSGVLTFCSCRHGKPCDQPSLTSAAFSLQTVDSVSRQSATTTNTIVCHDYRKQNKATSYKTNLHLFSTKTKTALIACGGTKNKTEQKCNIGVYLGLKVLHGLLKCFGWSSLVITEDGHRPVGSIV